MGAGGRTEETDGTGADNVIRFPRDWFGSKDDLVPFGPGADRLEAARAAEAAESAPEDPSAALSANDFWGEDSGALHQPVSVPDRPEPADVIVFASNDTTELELELGAAPASSDPDALNAVRPRGGRLTSPARLGGPLRLSVPTRPRLTLPARPDLSRSALSVVVLAVMMVGAVAFLVLGRTGSRPAAAHQSASRAVTSTVAAESTGLLGAQTPEGQQLLAVAKRNSAHTTGSAGRHRTSATVKRHPVRGAVKQRVSTRAHRTTANTAAVVHHRSDAGGAPASTESDPTTASEAAPVQASTPNDSAAPVTSDATTQAPVSASLAAGPTSAGTAGTNCSPQCK